MDKGVRELLDARAQVALCEHALGRIDDEIALLTEKRGEAVEALRLAQVAARNVKEKLLASTAEPSPPARAPIVAELLAQARENLSR